MEYAHRERVEFSLTPHLPSPWGNGGHHHDLGVPSKCDGYAHLSCVCRPLDTLLAPLRGMMVGIIPSCWCYAYLLPSMLNPLSILCMLTLSMYAPLTTYVIISLVVWWLTSWPLLNHPTYVVPMDAYERKGLWQRWLEGEILFSKTLAPKYSPMPIKSRNHITPTWARGLTRSLFKLMWETHNYIRERLPLNPGCRWWRQ